MIYSSIGRSLMSLTFGEFRLVELVAVRQVGVFEVDLDL